DKHGARLVAALRAASTDREWDLFGAGGDEMRAEGVDTLVDARDLAIMGVLEVAAALPRLLGAFRRLRQAALERRPDLVLVIDWPEFNLRLARRLRRDGHRIAYYISPQVWAWRSHRVNAIKRDIEQMLVILPFERDFYARAGVKVDYVGHPLLDSVFVTCSREEFCARHDLNPGRPIVALLPGSRQTELKFILPPMLSAIRELRRTAPEIQFVIPLAGTVNPSELKAAGEVPEGIHVIEGETYNAIAAADLAVVASGTATLETAIIGTPLIVVYKASQLNWRIFQPLINARFVGLPNLIADRQIAPELLQKDMNGPRLAEEIVALLGDRERLEQQRVDLNSVREKLGEANASQRAAEIILELLSRS
ncbi:MAG: lipid-A-disaccharide synthase, partial [Acidobacteriota bacterium]